MGSLVIQGRCDWFIGHRTSGDATLETIEDAGRFAPEELAESLVQRLSKTDPGRLNVVIGLDSNACLPAVMTLEHASAARDRTALAYSLEESLPLAAEEMEADYQFVGVNGLGIAVSAAALAPLVQDLEQRGVIVHSITSTALLAVQVKAGNIGQKGPAILLWEDSERVEVVLLERAVPRRWISVPADAASLTRELQALVLELGKPVEVISMRLPEPLLAAAEQILPVRGIDEPVSMREAATIAAADVLAGRLTPWFEFRRGKLGADDPRRPIRGVLRLLGFTAAVFLVCLTVALLSRASRFRQQTLSLQEEQAKVFQQAFPNERLPAGIRSRLESEVAKLAGSRGQGEEIPVAVPTLRLLKDFLVSLPKDMRYRIVDLRIEQDRLSLEMEVRSHSDADVIASALRKQGFVVDQPRSEQLPLQGVVVRLSAIAQQAKKRPTGET